MKFWWVFFLSIRADLIHASNFLEECQNSKDCVNGQQLSRSIGRNASSTRVNVAPRGSIERAIEGSPFSTTA